MKLIQLPLKKGSLRLWHWGEGVKNALIGAGGEEAPLDAQILHRLLEAKGIEADPNGTDQAGLIHMNGLRGHGDIVTTRGAEIGDHGMYRDIRVFLPQAADLVIDLSRLYRAPAGTVDAQYDALGIFVLVGLTQGLDDILGTGLGAGGYDPLDVDHGGMLLGQ